MPRDEKGRFTKEENGFSLTLPNPFSIIKYLILCLVLYPWYKILGLILLLWKITIKGLHENDMQLSQMTK